VAQEKMHAFGNKDCLSSVVFNLVCLSLCFCGATFHHPRCFFSCASSFSLLSLKCSSLSVSVTAAKKRMRCKVSLDAASSLLPLFLASSFVSAFGSSHEFFLLILILLCTSLRREQGRKETWTAVKIISLNSSRLSEAFFSQLEGLHRSFLQCR